MRLQRAWGMAAVLGASACEASPPVSAPTAVRPSDMGPAIARAKGTGRLEPSSAPPVCKPETFPPGGAGLFSFTRHELVGYRDQNGGVVIAPRYVFATEFTGEGVAAVIDATQGALFIDRAGGTVAHPFMFDNGPDDFVEGRARVMEAGQVGYIDRGGRLVISARYGCAERFCRGRAAVCVGCQRRLVGEHVECSGGRNAVIDLDGNEVD